MRLDHPYHHTKNCDKMDAGLCYPCANVELMNANASMADKVKELEASVRACGPIHESLCRDCQFGSKGHDRRWIQVLCSECELKPWRELQAANTALAASLAREVEMREAVEDCARYFDYASRKHVLPEGAVEAMTLCMKALRLSAPPLGLNAPSGSIPPMSTNTNPSQLDIAKAHHGNDSNQDMVKDNQDKAVPRWTDKIRFTEDAKAEPTKAGSCCPTGAVCKRIGCGECCDGCQPAPHSGGGEEEGK